VESHHLLGGTAKWVRKHEGREWLEYAPLTPLPLDVKAIKNVSTKLLRIILELVNYFTYH
jgi:hypothetical protein